MSYPRVVYASYDGFLKTTLETYWSKRRNQVHFVALLLASREAWEVAWGGMTAPGSGQKALTGAAGAAAIYVALRLLIGGPIASLVTLYVQNHRRIWDQQERYKKLIAAYRVKYDQIKAKYVEGLIDEPQRDLMIDGLMNRFFEDIDADPEATHTPGIGPKSTSS
jgi:hypothetical protein